MVPGQPVEELNHEKLYAALFELADVWCQNIDAFEYKDFFETLEKKLKYSG